MSDWRKSAACAGYDPALWFPGNSQLMRREAIHICHTCPVMMQCRKYAETNNQICGYPLQGIWGGKEFNPRKYRRKAPRRQSNLTNTVAKHTQSYTRSTNPTIR